MKSLLKIKGVKKLTTNQKQKVYGGSVWECHFFRSDGQVHSIIYGSDNSAIAACTGDCAGCEPIA